MLCPALTPEDQLTPVHQPTAHYATTAVVLGLLPLQGGGLQESPRANSSPFWKVNRHPEALGMQSAQRDFDVTETSPLRTWHPMEVGGTKLQLEPGLWSLSCSTAEKNILARFRFPPNSTKSFQQELLFVWLVCFFVFNDFIILHILPEGCCLRVF